MKGFGWIWLAVAVVAGALIGYQYGTGFKDKAPGQGAPASKEGEGEKKPLFYRNPMNPSITSPVPAKDDMGMDYIPVYADDQASKGPAGTVRIDPTVEHNIGVRVTRAGCRPISRLIRVPGRVAYVEDDVTVVHPRIKGWVREVAVKKMGERVESGGVLLTIYSPELVTSEQEYILALKGLEELSAGAPAYLKRSGEELLQSARQRLVLMDVPESEIKRLEEGGGPRDVISLPSPVSGFVVGIGVSQGDYVSPATALYRIASLSRVEVRATLYEPDLSWVRRGDQAEIVSLATPGQNFNGAVDEIYPFMDNRTRSATARLVLSNKGLKLRPDMFVNVTIHASRVEKALVVPSESIVRSGTREQVFVKVAPGTFEPRDVTTGLEAGGYVQVLKGVRPGEEVVSSAQFLIDSESKLREATAKMVAPAKDAGTMGEKMEMGKGSGDGTK